MLSIAFLARRVKPEPTPRMIFNNPSIDNNGGVGTALPAPNVFRTQPSDNKTMPTWNSTQLQPADCNNYFPLTV